MKIIIDILLAGCNICYVMDVKEFARLGGYARAKSLTAKERRESATNASKAAAETRRQKAKARKRAERDFEKLKEDASLSAIETIEEGQARYARARAKRKAEK